MVQIFHYLLMLKILTSFKSTICRTKIKILCSLLLCISQLINLETFQHKILGMIKFYRNYLNKMYCRVLRLESIVTFFALKWPQLLDKFQFSFKIIYKQCIHLGFTHYDFNFADYSLLLLSLLVYCLDGARIHYFQFYILCNTRLR